MATKVKKEIEKTEKKGNVLKGVVVSDKMDKTVVVLRLCGRNHIIMGDF